MARYFKGPCIHGKTLQVLQQLLKDGYMYTSRNGDQLRFLQKLFPSIKRSQYLNRSIYYLEGHDEDALREMMHRYPTRIISFQDLNQMIKTFDAKIENKEKRAFLGKKRLSKRIKVEKKIEGQTGVTKETQSTLDDFLGRFLHSEGL